MIVADDGLERRCEDNCGFVDRLIRWFDVDDGDDKDRGSIFAAGWSSSTRLGLAVCECMY